jgi:hypothetical protein
MRKRWARHVAHMREMINLSILIEKEPEGKRTLGRQESMGIIINIILNKSGVKRLIVKIFPTLYGT